jgi:hypothetical protein
MEKLEKDEKEQFKKNLESTCSKLNKVIEAKNTEDDGKAKPDEAKPYSF